MSTRSSRRRFMANVATVSGALFAGPYLLRAAAPNSKLHFAYVGTGGRAGSHLGMGDIAVAYCDPDRSRWPKKDRFASATGYTDYRQMLDKHLKEIDAITVATPDHHHFMPSMIAITNGKHVYTEKPLTWSVDEARRLAEATRKHKVATQMGNQGHANKGNRLVVEWVRRGGIGVVKEVHTWTNRPVWPQGMAQRPPTQPVPANLDWESWIGPAPWRDYHDGLHSFKWRGWFDFGCGDIGDMGCHTWDCVFWALDPDYPTATELVKIESQSKEAFPSRSMIKWSFPAKRIPLKPKNQDQKASEETIERAAFDAYWYSGGWKPQNLPDVMQGKELKGSGSLFIGSKGVLYVQGDYGDSPRIVPEPLMQAYLDENKGKEPLVPPSPGHAAEFLAACRGDKPYDYPGSNFADYAGPITEVMLLGSIAIKLGRVGYRFDCDAASRAIVSPDALALRARTPRQGWGV